LASIWRVVADSNRYFASEEPWLKRKTDPARMASILFVTAEVLRVVAILTQPFMPSAMSKLLDSLGVAPDARTIAAIGTAPALVAGASLPPPTPVFPRYIEKDEPENA
jgi:methionyl-tRNA synthetase